MRWLKHLTAAHLDERLSDLITECGLEAYGFWWLLLEVVAQSVKGDECEITYSLPQWSHLLYSHHHKVGKYLGKLHSSGLVVAEKVGSKWTVRIPNLLKYRDEYARKAGHLSGQTPDVVRPKSIDTDREREEEKQKTPTESKRKSAKELVEEFQVTDEHRTFAKAHGKDADALYPRWLNHYRSNGFRVGKNPLADADASFRTWMLDEKNSDNRQANLYRGPPGAAPQRPGPFANHKPDIGGET